MKKIAIILGMLTAIAIGSFVYIQSQIPTINEDAIQISSSIEYPPEFNYRQTGNDCGPFNVAAVVRALTKQDVDSQEFAENIDWRLPNNYTLPWGLEKQLKENDITIETPRLGSLSDEDKIRFLQEQLSLERPIIILGERDNYEHYITLLGFDSTSDEFFIYDSLADEDENGDAPGNINLNSQEMLDFWGGGGMYGLYNWYAIVAQSS